MVTDTEHLGQRVSKLRASKNLSQAALGKLVGKSQKAVQKVESGEILNPTFLLELAQALGTTPEYLKTGKSSGTVDVSLGANFIAAVTNPADYQKTGWHGRPIVVTASLSQHQDELFELEMVRGGLVLYPRDFTGNRGSAIPFDPSGEWYTGVVPSGERMGTCRITGVVRSLTVLCNTDLD